MKEDSFDYQYYLGKLKKSHYLSQLDDKLLKEFLNIFYIETWPKGLLSFHGDKTLYRFYFIVSGRLKMYKIHPQKGTEFTLYINSYGDFFDVISLLDGNRHEINMEALDEMVLLAAPIDIVREWIQKHPSFNRLFLPYIAKKFRNMEESANELALFDTWTRTLKLFIKHTSENSHDLELKLINNLSHSEIAKIIGTSKNVINRHIQKLKEENILHINRKHIEVKNMNKLLEKLNEFD